MNDSTYPTYIPWTNPDYFFNYTVPTPPVPPEVPNTAHLETISLAVRAVAFVICLIENSIAVFILCENIRSGRKVFSQFMLINLACTDILKAIFYYPAEFVKFSNHGEFVWLVQGHSVRNALCKMYNTVSQIPFRVVVLTLVALACNATRNSSSKGRKEHTRKFSAILTLFFWIAAAGLSSIYFVISKVENYMCAIDSTHQMVNMAAVLIIAFVVPADLILMILSAVVFFRVRRRKKEVTAPKRSTENANKRKLPGRQKKIRDAKKVDAPELAQLGKWCEEDTGGEDLTDESTRKLSSAVTPPETFNLETQEVSGTNGGGLDEEDALSNTSQTAEEIFQDTQTEAKIMSGTSLPFVVISILIVMFPFFAYFLSSSQLMYMLFAVQIADDIYVAIKPGIYASADKEFRKRYKQLSPFACCCFRRIRCGAEQQNVGPEKIRATQEKQCVTVNRVTEASEVCMA